MAKKQRLDKAISMQGNLSRSEVKTLIRKGAVTVNGQVVKAADFGVDFDKWLGGFEDVFTAVGKAALPADAPVSDAQ